MFALIGNFVKPRRGGCVNLKHSACAASTGYWTSSDRTWFASMTFEQLQ